MAWVNPTAFSSGQVYTALEDGIRVTDFLYLFNRVRQFVIPPQNASNQLGTHPTKTLTAGQTAFFEFDVPADFDPAGAWNVEVIVSNSTTITPLTYALDTNYYSLANSEVYNNHTGTVSGATQNLTANVPKALSVDSYLTSLAAGDSVGVKYTASTIPSGAHSVHYLRLQYTRI